MAAEAVPGLSCPTCSNVFSGPGSATAPWKTKCGHVVCGVCVEAAKTLKFVACPVCKAETGGLYVESTGLSVLAAKEHARLHPEEAKVVLCEDCLAAGDEDALPACFCCEGCKGAKGEDRMICEVMQAFTRRRSTTL